MAPDSPPVLAPFAEPRIPIIGAPTPAPCACPGPYLRPFLGSWKCPAHGHVVNLD